MSQTSRLLQGSVRRGLKPHRESCLNCKHRWYHEAAEGETVSTGPSGWVCDKRPVGHLANFPFSGRQRCFEPNPSDEGRPSESSTNTPMSDQPTTSPDAQRGALPQRDCSAWRTIESIPKDGTPVLVCSPGMSYPEVAWFEKNGGVIKTYELWMPLPAVPNK